jgi:sugar fermentation stimulation protein A
MNLYEGTFLRRYKRFFADIKLDNGDEIVAHVANTGSMKTCLGENFKAFVTHNDDPKRKLKYTLEYIKSPEGLIGVNTSKTNSIVKEALEKNLIPELTGYESIQSEKSILDSRFDFFLSEHKSGKECFLEVKNVTMAKNGMALFPDAVTSRGQKHLKELISLKNQGYRSVMLFIIQREGISSFQVADDIDPAYAELLNKAKLSGVEVLAYQTRFDLPLVSVHQKIPWTHH